MRPGVCRHLSRAVSRAMAHGPVSRAQERGHRPRPSRPAHPLSRCAGRRHPGRRGADVSSLLDGAVWGGGDGGVRPDELRARGFGAYVRDHARGPNLRGRPALPVAALGRPDAGTWPDNPAGQLGSRPAEHNEHDGGEGARLLPQELRRNVSVSVGLVYSASSMSRWSWLRMAWRGGGPPPPAAVEIHPLPPFSFFPVPRPLLP